MHLIHHILKRNAYIFLKGSIKFIHVTKQLIKVDIKLLYIFILYNKECKKHKAMHMRILG